MYDEKDYKLNSYLKQVEHFLDDGQDRNFGCFMLSAKTPDLFIDMGFSKKPILMTHDHAYRMAHEKTKHVRPAYHGLSQDVLKNLANLLANPILVYESPGVDDKICVLTDAKDGDGLPVVGILRPNGHAIYKNDDRLPCNFLTSAYGMNKNRVERDIESAFQNDGILYIDQEKVQALFQSDSMAGKKLPEGIEKIESGKVFTGSKVIEYTKTHQYVDKKRERHEKPILRERQKHRTENVKPCLREIRECTVSRTETRTFYRRIDL